MTDSDVQLIVTLTLCAALFVSQVLLILRILERRRNRRRT
jgi:hypothetical protein